MGMSGNLKDHERPERDEWHRQALANSYKLGHYRSVEPGETAS